jgi:UDP-N-acetylglucosamine diphosphorylase / glucose-1-phosphate thymidylyltransferase / UDP-N-acetylgalactosamine diphosphorylase / glucosamine-1-phosphate N-acetyltransferase / galactosamine-1-phosphate N-acetyltransferase
MPHYLDSLVDKEEESPAFSLKVLNYELIVRNVMVAQNILNIDTVSIPDKFPNACKLIQDNFPAISIKEFHDSEESFEKYTRNVSDSPSAYRLNIPVVAENDSIEIPINSLIHNSCYLNSSPNFYDNSSNNHRLIVDLLTYPWDFLNAVQTILRSEVTRTIISPKANVAQSSILTGPCIIEDDVIIDDFCKIIGPTYIASGSFIGMSSLVRKSMLGINTKIGFNCDIARTYFEGHDRIAHQNVILDSIIGKNVWFGGYSGTVNVSLDRKNVSYQIGDRLVDTGTDRFGAVVGNNCAIGASVITLPGRQIPSNTVIQAATVVGKRNLPDKSGDI